MHNRKYSVAGVVALSIGLLGLTALPETGAADDVIIVPQDIRDAVNKMADTVHKGKRIDKDADEFFKDHKDSLKQTMWVFKPREKGGKGGFGIGHDPSIYKLDGIEMFLNDQKSKTPQMPLDTMKSAADLIRLADVTLAMADIVYRYCPDKEKVGANNWEVWTYATDNMKKGSLDLKAGVKENDPVAIKRALFVVHFACTRCHDTFRDKVSITQKRKPARIIVPKNIQDAVTEMADEISQGKNINKATAAFFKAHPGDLQTTMLIFKPRIIREYQPTASVFIVGGSITEILKSNVNIHGDSSSVFIVGGSITEGLKSLVKIREGGFGIGPKPGVYPRDGIEVLIITKGNPKPRNAEQKVTSEELEKNGVDYIRAADVTIAMAELTHQYKPTMKLPDKDPADWTKFTDEMKKAAIDVKAGVKAKNPVATKMGFIQLYSSCTNCHSMFRDAEDAKASDPPPFLKAFNSMADAVGKGQKFDKDLDVFFKEYKGEFKNVKSLFQAHPKNGRDGLHIGANRGANTPDDVESYVAVQSTWRMTDPQLKVAAGDLNRLADVMIVMAAILERYKPNNIVIGGPTGVAKPAEWMASVDSMKQGAVDLKAAVKANKADSAKLAFKKIQASCVACHYIFRD